MKKLIALLLVLVMALSLVACGAAETPATEAPAADAPAADAKMYIPVMAKGFQHQFWQAVKAGADQGEPHPIVWERFAIRLSAWV